MAALLRKINCRTAPFFTLTRDSHNYLTFRRYAKGEPVEEIAIGQETDNVRAKNILPLPDNFDKFSELIRQFAVYQTEGFKSILIDAISTKDFADLYAQTIAYGMFAARMNTSPPVPLQNGEGWTRSGRGEDFTREQAAKSIPQTNPFLIQQGVSINIFVKLKKK